MKSVKIAFTAIVLVLAFQSTKAEWVKQNTNSFAWYRDIFFVNDKKGWITGTDGVLLSTDDGGKTWIQAKKFTSDALVQVYFKDEVNGWLLCERNIYARGGNAISYVRKTTDGGRTWTKIEFMEGSRERITRIFFNADGIGTAFGEGGVFYKSDRDGVTWRKLRTAIHYLLLDAAFANESLAAIVGAGGTILFTDDAGNSWENATLFGDKETRFNAVTFAGLSGWAVGSGGRIFHSNAGGRQWRQQYSPVTADLNDVVFTTAQSGWAVGDNGVIVRTTDGGQSWIDVSSHVNHKLEKVIFVGGKGWAIGFGGTILAYRDAGSPGVPDGKPVLTRRS